MFQTIVVRSHCLYYNFFAVSDISDSGWLFEANNHDYIHLYMNTEKILVDNEID